MQSGVVAEELDTGHSDGWYGEDEGNMVMRTFCLRWNFRIQGTEV